MMKTINLFILIGIMTLYSCDKEQNSFIIDVGVEITVLDQSGNNLLDPSTPNAFEEDSIKIYYLIDGNIEEVYHANYDYPRNFFIYKSDKYVMRLFLNGNDDSPITYIKWNANDTDTLKGKFSSTENSVICRSVWYNDSLVWDDMSYERAVQIKK